MKRNRSRTRLCILSAVVALFVGSIALLVWTTWLYRTSLLPSSASPAYGSNPNPVAQIPAQQEPPQPVFSHEIATSTGFARVIDTSAPIFAYAHTLISADGKFFVGMAGANGNPFKSDQITVFDNPADLSSFKIIHLAHMGDVVTMAYDPMFDKIYFLLTGNKNLELYSLDPQTLWVRAIASTTAIDAGWRPAIVTDGQYVYGITYGEPSSVVFKIRLSDGQLSFTTTGHIPDGHSASISIFGSSTELYFGGDASNMFEKVDAATLTSFGKIKLADQCTESNNMPFVQTDARSGYVYSGCETAPCGYRIRTSDLKVDRFDLPGYSYGLFVFGNDLYNTGQDGALDVFRNYDISKLERYRLVNGTSLDPHGQVPALNELAYSTSTNSIYFTAWWGVPGLFRVATSTK